MAPLKVLVCGGGISGPAIAFWLSKLGHDVTVVERFPSLRATGQQLDLRGPGIQVMKRMGLEEIFRSKGVSEKGMQFVDDYGKRKAFFPVNQSGKGLQSFTTDFEIMRGDLCRILYSVTEDRVKYIFGVYLDGFEQDEDSDSVRVKFSDGKEDQFDLLIGADGQGSRTRRMMLGPNGPDPFHSLGISIAYFTIPREEGDDYMSTLYNIPGKRFVFTRRHAPDTIQAYLGYANVSDELEKVRKRDIKEQKRVWAKLFDDGAWKTPRIIREMQNETTAKDFYSQEVGQVKLDSWSRGRVVLVGDAAYCPSPATGMGTTSGLVGAYVLAGEIAKHCGPSGSSNSLENPLSTALKAYDDRFRPFMDQVHTLGPGMPGRAIPETRWGIYVMHLVLWLSTLLGIDAVAQWFLREQNVWDLPDYAELGVLIKHRPDDANAKKTY
ncbi:Aromatic-ring hydroxylase-like [Ilyonectria robusta]